MKFRENKMHNTEEQSILSTLEPTVPPIATTENRSKQIKDEPIVPFIDRIICGDALAVMRRLPNSSADLVVTSPPYNLKNSTGNGTKDGRGGKWSNARLINGYAGHHDNMPHM